MGPDLELKGKLEATPQVLVSEENIPAPAFSGQKVMLSGTIDKGDAYAMEVLPIEQTSLSCENEDVEVNITGCTNSGKALVVEDACEDLTECSSSFGDTGSDIENGSNFSDIEVESRICAGNASSSMYDDLCGPFRIRKKRMTIHWRRFIRPLMWRCKWIELKLKQLQSQALKYDRELEAYKCRKQLEVANFTVDGFDAKSVPVSGWNHRNKVMKRKKRKRVEEKCDLSSYMSDHSIFSYYENKGHTDGACLEDFRGVALGNANNNEDFKLNDMWSSIDYEDSDKSLDDIIQKIEEVHSHVHKLKTRIDKVVSENPGKFCSVTQLSMPGPSDGLNGSDLKSPTFAGNENPFTANLLMPGNTLSTSEGITPLLETTGSSHLEALLEDTKDGVLIQNTAAKEELDEFENVRNQLAAEETKESNEVQKSISLAQVMQPDMVTENAVLNVHPTLNTCSTSKPNFRRSKRRKSQKSVTKRSSRR